VLKEMGVQLVHQALKVLKVQMVKLEVQVLKGVLVQDHKVPKGLKVEIKVPKGLKVLQVPQQHVIL
jgi:hypothetical protein